jgi:hypothetical protein
MSQAGKYLRRTGDGYSYWCQGCEEMHAVTSGWEFNGNLDAPTFSPSVLVTSGHFMSSHKPGDACWCTYNASHPDKPARFKCRRCHTFIKAGMVQFLGDCTHALAGQTLMLPELPPNYRDGAL